MYSTSKISIPQLVWTKTNILYKLHETTFKRELRTKQTDWRVSHSLSITGQCAQRSFVVCWYAGLIHKDNDGYGLGQISGTWGVPFRRRIDDWVSFLSLLCGFTSWCWSGWLRSCDLRNLKMTIYFYKEKVSWVTWTIDDIWQIFLRTKRILVKWLIILRQINP